MEDSGIDVHVVESFDDLVPVGLPRYVSENLKWNKIAAPMHIQKYVIAGALGAMSSDRLGCNVIGIARTGSGKTLGFLIPMLVHLTRDASRRALIMAPTRELADQINKEFQKLDWGQQKAAIGSVCCFGGQSRHLQKPYLAGSRVVVGTPGRLQDFYDAGDLILQQTGYFALDEADRMLEEGFEESVFSLAKGCSRDRQTMFFTATWPPHVKEVALRLCDMAKPRRPLMMVEVGQTYAAQDAGEEVSVGQVEVGQMELTVHADIDQEIRVYDEPGEDNGTNWQAQEKMKKADLQRYIAEALLSGSDGGRNMPKKVLVFVNEKKTCEEVCNWLWDQGFDKANRIHGGLAQETRLNVLQDFRVGRIKLLVATNVIGRGLDIPDVSHVIIYDFDSVEDYVHRVGRTNRGEKRGGKAIVFYEYWHGAPEVPAKLIDILTRARQTIPPALERIKREVEIGKRQAFVKPSWNKNKR